jgi:hypothetical protein
MLEHKIGVLWAPTPIEVEHKSFCVQHFNEEQSDNLRVNDLTRLEKLREAVVIQLAKHQQAMRRYHTWNMSSCSFVVGDFVLWKIPMIKDRYKLLRFEVVEVTRPSSYRL